MAVEEKVQRRAERDSAPASIWALTGVTIAAIWVGVVLASIYAPDFVSGSQHEHLALVGGADWIWGLVATSFVVLAVQKGLRAHAVELTPWIALAAVVAVVWVGVAAVSAFAPVWVTGTDPTTIPAAAMGVPILGAFLTWFGCTLFRSSVEQEKT